MLLVAFGVFEGIAIANPKPGDTFSETLRRWLGVYPKAKRRWVLMPSFGVVLVGFVVWFVPHVIFGIWG